MCHSGQGEPFFSDITGVTKGINIMIEADEEV